ncbi:SOS response-associated peptidase [bacterium]|nr:MAG: SOS response-associated peptidase [bacterium]
MCGRYTQTTNLRLIQEKFDLANEEMKELIENFRPNYNVAPTHMVQVIVQENDKLKMKLMKWGLVPSWAPDPKKFGFSTINARSEEIHTKASYKNLIPKRRCLIVADSFYEFEKVGKEKRPVRFMMKDKSVFSFAGLYDVWKKEGQNPIVSCTILTTQPNKTVAKYHNRMPVMLEAVNERPWLDPERKTYEDITPFLNPISEEQIIHYYANPAVNNVRNNAEHLIEEFDYSELGL